MAITGNPASLPDGTSIHGDLSSYTVRDQRGRALYTDSGWLDRAALPENVAEALHKYEQVNSNRVSAIESRSRDGARAGLKPDFTEAAAQAKIALLESIQAAL